LETLSPDTLVMGLLWYIVFLFSTTLHEAAHALAAKLGGDLTAFHGGQVTLDPMPHIRREPFGMVFVPIMTFLLSGGMMGWASAPYDPMWADRHPRRAALMSLAGPMANLSLVVLAGIGIRLGMASGVFEPPDSLSFMRMIEAPEGGMMGSVAMLLSATFALNLMLGIFNLLPVPPLDGSSAITLLMNRPMQERWTQLIRHPALSMIGILVAWQVFGEIFRPFKDLAIVLLYPEYSYQ